MKSRPINTAGRYLKKFSWLWLAAALLLLPFGWWRWVNLAVDSQNLTEIEFSIPEGQATAVIARRLDQEKLIKSSWAFRLLVDRKNLSGKLQAGDFRLSQAMDLDTVVNHLVRGSRDVWVTLPEGWRAEEYAERLADKAGIDADEFITAAKPFEGQLFPDTYRVPVNISVNEVVSLLRRTFDQKSPTDDKRLIIIASLIEREAKHDADRPLVAGVIFNRLKLGMPLQLDATVQYALGRLGDWWPGQLTKDDLQINSPFNTYLVTGLPPGPIANPGLKSLAAAVSPAATDYLYYISDAGGYNHYGRTLEEHQQNIAQYLPLDN